MVEKIKNIAITEGNCESLRDEMIPIYIWAELNEIHNDILQIIEDEELDEWE